VRAVLLGILEPHLDLPGFLLFAALARFRDPVSGRPAWGVLKARSHVGETLSPLLKLSNDFGIDPALMNNGAISHTLPPEMPPRLAGAA